MDGDDENASSTNDRVSPSATEQQIEKHRCGTIWYVVRTADQKELERLVESDLNVIHTRGPVGECPIHMLFLYGSECHLHMAKYLITKFPSIIMQYYNLPVSILKNLIP